MSAPGCRVHWCAPLLITSSSKHLELIGATWLGIRDQSLPIVVSRLIVQFERRMGAFSDRPPSHATDRTCDAGLMPVTITRNVKEAYVADGVAKLTGLFDSDQLAQLLRLFEWTVAHPSPNASHRIDGDTLFHSDNLSPDAPEVYRDTVLRLPFGDALTQLWNTEEVHYFGEEVFWKQGTVGRTQWHQDTSYYPWGGSQWVNMWISFDPVPLSHALEVIRGSHRQTLYDGTRFDPSDPTLPLWGDAGDFPRLPDIEAERANDPNSWDAVAFDIEPGDALLLHPGTLHGGGPVDTELPSRRTLALRFFGSDAVWADLPSDRAVPTEDQIRYTSLDNRGTPGTPMAGVNGSIRIA